MNSQPLSMTICVRLWSASFGYGEHHFRIFSAEYGVKKAFAPKGRKSDAETVSDEDCVIVKTVQHPKPLLPRPSPPLTAKPASSPAGPAPSHLLTSAPSTQHVEPSSSTNLPRSPSIARSGCDSDDIYGPEDEEDLFGPDYELP